MVAAALTAPLWLYQDRLASFSMAWDDFKLLPAAMDWQRTRAALFEPISAHFCPPVRLLTWALVQWAGSLTAIPGALRWSPIVSLVLLLLLLHEFVRRETRSAPAALTAVIAAGITSAYFPAFALFVTSQIFWSLAAALATLLCVQTLLAKRCAACATGAVAFAALAPAWFSTGLVAGPVASLYPLVTRGPIDWRRRCAIALLPSAGTLLFVAVALALAGKALFDPANLGHQSLEKTLRPDIGFLLALRASAEHVLRWSIAVTGHLDGGQGVVHVVVFLGLVAWSFERCQSRRLAVCGAVLALAGNWLLYTFRSYWGFDVVQANRWYLAYPHVGWSMLLAALVFPARQAVRHTTLSVALRLALVGVALFLLHRPIVVAESDALKITNQPYELRRLELLQAVCLRWNVSVGDVRQALNPIRLGAANQLDSSFDGLDLLVTPDTPDSWPNGELRLRLERVLETGSIDAFAEPALRP